MLRRWNPLATFQRRRPSRIRTGSHNRASKRPARTRRCQPAIHLAPLILARLKARRRPTAQDVDKGGAGTSAASGIEKCVYRKDRVRSEGNPADVPSTVSGTVHKAKAGDLDGGEPGIVLPEYASEEVWVLVLDAPTTLSGSMSGRPGEVEVRANQECIGIVGSGDLWDGYEGMKVTLPIDATSGFWQSDVSVPMGTLRMPYIPADIL